MAKVLLKGLFHICLERKPSYLTADDGTVPAFELTMKRHRILSSAWKEYVGHTNPNKVEALPINEAIAAAAQLDIEINEAILSQEESFKDKISNWKSYRRHDFYLNGREAILVEPKSAAAGNPWIWRTEFFDAFSYADMAMLEKGYCIAYYRISNLYGCPEAVVMMHDFHNYLIKSYGLSNQAVLFGFSRGGLYAFNYAATYSNMVSAIYLDAPVLDLRSWPGGEGKVKGHPENGKNAKLYMDGMIVHYPVL